MLAISRKFPAKRAFVTGAGSGLGLALARALAKDGWTIAVTDLREETLAPACDEVTRLGGRAHPYRLDVTSRADWETAKEAFLAETGGVDLVVNNAGVAGAGPVGEFPLDDWEWLLRTNLQGVVNGCHYFAPVLKSQRGGHLVNIASAAALVAVPTMGAYCTAKAAVKMLSEVLHNELVPAGAGVTVSMPEFFRTNLADRTRDATGRARALIERSKFSADDVALALLDDAAHGELYAPFPRRTRVLWWLTRLAPVQAWWLVRKEERRRADRHAARHGRG